MTTASTTASKAHFDRQYKTHLKQLKLKGLQPKTIDAYSRAFPALQHHATVHQSGLEIAANQPQYRTVVDPLAQSVHQDVVVDPVKELLQVHVHHRPLTFLHIPLGLLHRVMRSSAGPQAVAVLGECRIDQRLQHLQQGLLVSEESKATFPLDSKVRTFVKPTDSKHAFSSGILAFSGLTPRNSAT